MENDVKKSSTALKAGIGYTISNFISKGLLFITTPIFTRLLTKGEFGVYSNFVNWHNVLIIITSLLLYSTVLRAKYDYEGRMDEYLSSIAVASATFTALCYIVVIVCMDMFTKLLGLEPKYIHILFAYLLTAPALNIYQAKNRAYMKYKAVMAVSVSSAVLSIIVALAMVMISDDKLWGRIFGQEIILIIFNTVLFGYILCKGRRVSKDCISYGLKLSLPLIPHTLSVVLLSAFDKIAIEKFCGYEELALYSLAFNCGAIAQVLWDSFNQAMSPWLYANINNGNTKKIKSVSRYYISGFVGICIGLMLCAPELMYIFGGEDYMQAKYVMPAIIASCCFQFAYSMYVNVEMYYKKMKMIAMGTLLATIINIALNCVFVPRFGYIAAAYTTMAGYAFLQVFHYLISKYYGYDRLYDNRYTFGVMVTVLAVIFPISYIYEMNLLRRGILIVYTLMALVLAVVNRKKVWRVLKNG